MPVNHTFAVMSVQILLIAGAFAPSARAADAGAEPKSPAAVEARKEYDAAVAKAEAEIAAAKKAYLAKLDVVLKAAMTAGDLDEANRIDALRKATTNPTARAAMADAGKPAANNSEAKPGWILGNITDSAGKPITGATFEVAAFGTTIQGGQRAEFRLEVNDKGHFEQEVPDGLYAVTAYVIKEYAGSRFRLPLYPNDGKHALTKLGSKSGIVKDFTWKLTGLQPGGDPKNQSSYYGQTVRLYDANYLGEDNEKLYGTFGKEAKVIVTLTPNRKMIDGNEGKPITITATLGEIGQTLGHLEMDVPIGEYLCEAKVTANGKEQPLKVASKFHGDFAATVDATFVQRSAYDSVQAIQLYIGK